jgi:hypothetical protein
MVTWFFIVTFVVGTLNGIVTSVEMRAGRYLTQALCEQARQDFSVHLLEPLPQMQIAECRMKLQP